MQTKEVPIEWEGKPAIVEIKKMGFVDKKKWQASFVKAIMEINPATKKEGIKTEVDIFQREIEGLMRGIVKAPFAWQTEEDLNKVPPNIGEKIWSEIEDFNNLGDKKKEKSDGSSEKSEKSGSSKTQKSKSSSQSSSSQTD